MLVNKIGGKTRKKSKKMKILVDIIAIRLLDFHYTAMDANNHSITFIGGNYEY